MSFALGISDFSIGEGVYTARLLLKLARALGYCDLVLWDRGLQGWPKLRGELEWARELEGLGHPHPSFEGTGPRPTEFRIHLGCRFVWKGHALGALIPDRRGYQELCRLLTVQAHGKGEGDLPGSCLLVAEDEAGIKALGREGLCGSLLAHPQRAQEVRRMVEGGTPVVAPQVLRFSRPQGLELHRLKRAIASQSTLPRTEALWNEKEGAVSRSTWEARFPAADPEIRRATESLLEQVSGWTLPWGTWVNADPLGVPHCELNGILRAKVETGLRALRPGDSAALERMEMELALIAQKGFAGYFLLVQDIVHAVRATGQQIRICGRGSGAASIVSYALGLSNVDPVATNLMFERFLTPERKDPPDMDIDFAWDERDAVIQAVFDRYGRDRVAMVANHVFFKRRSALRAVAMAYGRPPAEMKTMSQRILGWDGGVGDLPETHPWDPILHQAERMRGHFQQFSVHPGGTVVTPGPLWEHCASLPAPAKEGVSITTWDKDGVEGYGLVKIDLLGNRSLAVIRDAYEVLHLPMTTAQAQAAREDPETQALLARGDSIGVFYVESPATRQLQQRVGKGDFETLVIHSSLIRPAAYRWVDRYVKRSRGEETFQPSHPVFTSLLSDSFGVLIYQEDVIQVCVAMAGWSHHRADQLRKLLGKPGCEEKLPLFEAEFRNGAAAREVPAAVIEEAWDMIRTFQGYSFCKPHSASYAQVSFESAWLKAHHPAVFFASVIANQGGFYPAIAYLGDARRHRLVVRGADANASEWVYRAEGEGALRVGLMAIRGAREDEVRALLAERERRGPFASLAELLERVSLSIPTMEALGSAGAFDLWAPDGDRTRLLWARLGGVPEGLRPRPTDPFDRADLELELMGLTLEVHPAALARVRKSGGPNRAAEVIREGRFLRFWALVVAEKQVSTERGETMQFLTFEDETGLCEAVAFPDAYRRRRRPWQVGEVVLVQGRSTRQDGLAVLEVAS